MLLGSETIQLYLHVKQRITGASQSKYLIGHFVHSLVLSKCLLSSALGIGFQIRANCYPAEFMTSGVSVPQSSWENIPPRRAPGLSGWMNRNEPDHVDQQGGSPLAQAGDGCN